MHRHLLALLLCGLPVVASGPGPARAAQPDPPAPTWNDPPPPGVETVKPMRPTWCAGHKARPWLPGSLAYDEIKRGYTEQALMEIAQLACDRPDDPGRQRWIAFYRQGWLNIVGTTEKEDRQAMAARLALKAQGAQLQQICKGLYGTPKDRPPAERLFNRLRAQIIGCAGMPFEVIYGTDGGNEMAAVSHWIDRDAEPPDELVRLAWVLRCFNPGTSSIDPATAYRALGRYAMCGHDAAKLDRRTFEKALAALKLPPLGQVRAREMFAYTRKLMASYRAAFKDLAAKDKDYARILAGPARGFADWVELRAANQATFDEALAMEDKFRDGDKRAVAGCSESLRRRLADHVASRAPRTKHDIIDAANDDVGQPLLRALIACDSLGERYGLVDFGRQLLGGGRLRRGPRMAALWHTLDIVSEIAAERIRFPVQPKSFGGPMPRADRKDDWMITAWESTFNRLNLERTLMGRVATVKPSGDGVLVTFKTQSWKEPVYKCKETNRIDRITPEGRVVYREHCVSAGTETVKVTPLPAWIRKDLAHGLKPGAFVKYRLDKKPDPDQGFPMEVYADQAQKRPLAYFGLPVAP